MFSYSEFKHDYELSHFRYIEPISDDYRVFLNGEEIPVYTCRISKFPFNRIWPGFQRPFDQSEQASYVNIVSDEEITLEVIVNRKYEKILIKPYSKNIEFSDEGGKVSFSLRENGQFVLEADSYHHCLYIFNSKPIAVPRKDEVTHFFGPGIHFPGKITLKTGDKVYIDKDALVFGQIFAENADDVHIFGNGVLDSGSEERVCIHCYEAFTNGNLKFYDCKNLRIEGIAMKNSAIWCVNLFGCESVTIDNIKVFGQWRYNTDGIDIVNSRNVRIVNSFVHSFDDTVTVKGIDRYIERNCEDITVEDSVLWCDWGRALEIGFETACREYKNIAFKNCDILRSGGIAMDIQNGDCAQVHDITFTNINVEFNAFDTPPVYQATDEMRYEKENETDVPMLINISNPPFRNKDNESDWGIPYSDYEEIGKKGAHGTAHDITFTNINVYYDDALPRENGKPIVKMCFYSFFPEIIYSDVSIENITVNGERLKKEDVKFEQLAVKNFSFK